MRNTHEHIELTDLNAMSAEERADFNGYGYFKDNDGVIFKSEFVNGVANGRGEVEYSSSKKFSGIIKDFQPWKGVTTEQIIKGIQVANYSDGQITKRAIYPTDGSFRRVEFGKGINVSEVINSVLSSVRESVRFIARSLNTKETGKSNSRNWRPAVSTVAVVLSAGAIGYGAGSLGKKDGEDFDFGNLVSGIEEAFWEVNDELARIVYGSGTVETPSEFGGKRMPELVEQIEEHQVTESNNMLMEQPKETNTTPVNSLNENTNLSSTNETPEINLAPVKLEVGSQATKEKNSVVSPEVIISPVIGKIETLEGIYEGEILNGKRHGNGTYNHKSSHAEIYYTGKWENDHFKKGYGVRVLKLVETFGGKQKVYFQRYEGDMIDAKEWGQGKFTWGDGSTYEGEWIDGKKWGLGKYTLSNGTFIDGEWENDHWHGRAIVKTDTGSLYASGRYEDKYIKLYIPGEKLSPDSKLTLKQLKEEKWAIDRELESTKKLIAKSNAILFGKEPVDKKDLELLIAELEQEKEELKTAGQVNDISGAPANADAFAWLLSTQISDNLRSAKAKLKDL